jgi:DNA polymerase-3 subunit gamma/tau
MSYLVLARKWRPEKFGDVVGQKHVVLTLAAAIESDRTAHAYLFAGPRGVGKTTVARILAKALNCAKGPTAEPCGECDSCSEVASGRSLDVIEIDGASNRKIEDARGIRETVQYAPLSGRMKVYIIDEAHMLTREAFNALLKTLEEPPPHVLFVLATTEPGKIPETIASRCQRFDFHRISTAEIEGRLSEIALAEEITTEDGALRLVAARADGSMRDAESLLDQLISVGKGVVTSDDVARVLGIPDVDVYFALSDAIAARDSRATLGALEAALNAGFDPRDLLDGLVEHLRNLLLVRAAPSPERLIGRIADYLEHEGQSDALGEDDLVRLARVGVEAQTAAKWSTQPGLIVELALMRMARLGRSVDIEDVLKAVRSADSGGGSGGGAERSKRKRAGAGEAAGSRADGGNEAVDGRGGAPRHGSPQAGARHREAAPRSRAGHPEGAAPQVSADRWPAVLERIRAERPSLAASLADAVPSVHGVGELGLHVPNGTTFHRDQLEDRSNLMIMENAATAVFGSGVRVVFDFGTNAGRRAGSTAGSAEASDVEDPMVRRVLEIFGGRLEETQEEG